MELYSYSKCGTCRKAIRFLENRKVKFELIDITEITPPKLVLKAAMKAKGMKKLFNTSGGQYRKLKLKDKLKTMTESQALDLLASDGMLIKRPIAVDKRKVTVGFDIEEYKKSSSVPNIFLMFLSVEVRVKPFKLISSLSL